MRKLAEPAMEQARAAGFELVVGTSGTIVALGQAVQRMRGGEPWTNPTGQSIRLDDLRILADELCQATPAERIARGVDRHARGLAPLGAVLFWRPARALQAGSHHAVRRRAAGGRRARLHRATRRRHPHVGGGQRHPPSQRDGSRAPLRTIGSAPGARRLIGSRDLRPDAALHDWASTSGCCSSLPGILHDVGQHIGYERHEHHAAYIIRNGELRGFTDQEREVLALVARYHRKARPKRRDADFTALPPRQRQHRARPRRHPARRGRAGSQPPPGRARRPLRGERSDAW